MKSRSPILCRPVVLALAVLALALVAGQSAPKARAAEMAGRPSHQVLACYFHRTVRCPTCQRISAYIEEALRANFAEELKAGAVKVSVIDFQDPRNQRYTQAYQIAGPTLVILDVRDGKVRAWKTAPKVWSLVGKKDDFFRYVRSEIQSYLEAP